MKGVGFEPEHPGYGHDLRDQGQEVKTGSLIIDQLETQTLLLNDLEIEVKHLVDRLEPVCREHSPKKGQDEDKSEPKFTSQVALHLDRNSEQISALQTMLRGLREKLEV